MTTNNPTSPREELARVERYVGGESFHSVYGQFNKGLVEQFRADLKLALSRPPVKAASPEGENASPLVFGMGALVVNTGTFEGDNAVFIAKAREPGPVGEYTGTAAFDRNSLQPGELVMIFPTKEQVHAVADALVNALPTSERAEVVAWPNDKPPPHWTPDDQFDRHPKTAEDWDWRTDPGGDERFERMIRRLNFAGDMADPRAPDQMALVLRKDLINIKHKLLRAQALADLYKRQSETPAPAQQEEPVAWHVGNGTDAFVTMMRTDAETWERNGATITPLGPIVLHPSEQSRGEGYSNRMASSSGPEPGPEGFAVQVPVITDEMVERAAMALTGARWDNGHKLVSGVKLSAREMAAIEARAALTAALATPGEG